MRGGGRTLRDLKDPIAMGRRAWRPRDTYEGIRDPFGIFLGCRGGRCTVVLKETKWSLSDPGISGLARTSHVTGRGAVECTPSMKQVAMLGKVYHSAWYILNNLVSL
jgi:hypothetical protein